MEVRTITYGSQRLGKVPISNGQIRKPNTGGVYYKEGVYLNSEDLMLDKSFSIIDNFYFQWTYVIVWR